MRLPSIKPVGGWPAFTQEILIVVVGVLLALGAQQAVESWQWRTEIRHFRAALDYEIGYNLGAYQDRLQRSGCIARRLDQLDRWAAGLKSGQRLRLMTPISRPLALATRSGVWDSRTPDAASHLGLENRLAYAKLYDNIGGLANVREAERIVWNELSEFEGADSLDRRDMMRLRGLIERARFLNQILRSNIETFRQRAILLGIRPRREADDPGRENALCQPLRWEPA